MAFWKEVFSKHGQSWGRVAAMMSLVNGIGWIWYLVLKVSNVADFIQLPQLAIFIGAVLSLVVGIYGTSKGLDTLKSIKGGGDAAPTPPAS